VIAGASDTIRRGWSALARADAKITAAIAPSALNASAAPGLFRPIATSRNYQRNHR